MLDGDLVCLSPDRGACQVGQRNDTHFRDGAMLVLFAFPMVLVDFGFQKAVEGSQVFLAHGAHVFYCSLFLHEFRHKRIDLLGLVFAFSGPPFLLQPLLDVLIGHRFEAIVHGMAIGT
jgi:hypothetical protein